MTWHMAASLVLLVSSATAQTPVRGVRKADWPAYAAVDGFFQCRDGTEKVPIAQLNGIGRPSPDPLCASDHA